ncbi:hypothetical protein P4U43_00275 [Arthrobacter sp. EH-1B-1]|uniref:Uncharacterized protein n=1 Tax=Arthrobacter vasquezii TaxID=2977629 RepID=A0ABT6CQ85_9MICC|nr:hypothetical protein [Arthrobacter vasquezii]MDF9276223.1 hypothetical protein [Arthrobacter vasquezii]
MPAVTQRVSQEPLPCHQSHLSSVLLRDIEAMAESVMALETRGDYGDHARVMRLLAKEPELLVWAAAQDQELAGELRARIASQVEGKVDSLTEVAVAVWRASWARCG